MAVDELVVGEAVAKGVDEPDVAAAPRLQQGPSDLGQLAALVPDPVLVGPPVHDVDRPLLAAVQTYGERVAVASQLCRGGEDGTEPVSGLGVLVVGHVARTVGEDDHAGVSARRRSRRVQDSRQQFVGDRIDRARGRKADGQGVGQRGSSSERVGDARGRTQVVLEDEELSSGIAHDIEPDDRRRSGLGREAPDQIGFKALGVGDRRRRDHPGLHDPLPP